MSRPKFIGIEAVLAIHYDQVNTFGGAHGLRDQGLLESAFGQAQQTFADTNDIHEAAAQYAVSLARNHPFVDGNKRTAADCMLTFLVLNGFEPTMTNEQLFEWTLKVAIEKLTRTELARSLRGHSRRR
ncbi:death-on-curing protein [Sulfurifustis variabilis]|uniref:Death-on-curing protein n=1 Tax=Sulfurifustis variabilis TaxID=1675686 RepID=A0A1B4V1U3_9GAMM|nr:type II toxin-antitoxin system death-on-curing family toxin [Sulfurifustis variabilis]BAU47466.1 death-on-curing protein [Sulfurifustis variabilis]